MTESATFDAKQKCAERKRRGPDRAEEPQSSRRAKKPQKTRRAKLVREKRHSVSRKKSRRGARKE